MEGIKIKDLQENKTYRCRTSKVLVEVLETGNGYAHGKVFIKGQHITILLSDNQLEEINKIGRCFLKDSCLWEQVKCSSCNNEEHYEWDCHSARFSI